MLAERCQRQPLPHRQRRRFQHRYFALIGFGGGCYHISQRSLSDYSCDKRETRAHPPVARWKGFMGNTSHGNIVLQRVNQTEIAAEISIRKHWRGMCVVNHRHIRVASKKFRIDIDLLLAIANA